MRKLVSVCCITFNQEKYIAEALDGFLSQKTNFPFEIIVHDDASTDKTAEILMEYAKSHPSLVFPILQTENQYSKNIDPYVEYVFPKAEGKYIALCEGDDYWTDPLKLQKQFDFMEKHMNCSLCFHSVQIVVKQQKIDKFIRAAKKDKIFGGQQMFGYGSTAPTPSLFFRKAHVENMPNWVSEAPVGDIPLKLFLSQKGEVAYLDDVMAIRRIGLKESWTAKYSCGSSRKTLFPAMITLLEEFNIYSGEKYLYEVLDKQLYYMVNLHDGLYSKFNAISKFFKDDRFKEKLAKISIMQGFFLFIKYVTLVVAEIFVFSNIRSLTRIILAK